MYTGSNHAGTHGVTSPGKSRDAIGAQSGVGNKLRRRARKSCDLRCVSREDTPDAPRAGKGSWTRERFDLDPRPPAVPLAIHRVQLRTVPLPGPEAVAAGFASPLPELSIIGRALRGVHVVLTGGDVRPVARLSIPFPAPPPRPEPAWRRRKIRPFPRTEPSADETRGMEPV